MDADEQRDTFAYLRRAAPCWCEDLPFVVIILLDAGPLGMVANPKGSPETEECRNWFQDLAYRGREFVIPEIGALMLF